MANDGDEVAVAPRLDPDDAEAVLGVLVGDALDQPRQHLPIGWLGSVFMMPGACRLSGRTDPPFSNHHAPVEAHRPIVAEPGSDSTGP